MLRGRKSLVRVNRLAYPESQGFLTSDPGHFRPHIAPPLRADAHATSKTMSWCAPKCGAGSALLLAAPERQRLSRVSCQHRLGMGEALASCPVSLETQGWPGMEARRNAANVGAVLLAQGIKRQLEARGQGVTRGRPVVTAVQDVGCYFTSWYLLL
ncbi:hypothetical protein AV530_017402 [Patagioenas fasciata monilis]|uniref:Uncharacterized protein n=1 Tax=Patagioenas fasciata monilis TaxID=372326 RepID=A0A1V4JG29_PATFA|nr:hypothetical protein AV530_017402 [Patagioenas fasciata monilis]